MWSGLGSFQTKLFTSSSWWWCVSSRNAGSSSSAALRLNPRMSRISRMSVSPKWTFFWCARGFMAPRRSMRSLVSASAARSVFDRSSRSAKPTWARASSCSSSWRLPCTASTTVTTASSRYWSWIFSSMKNVCATGPGLARPVVSMMTRSKRSLPWRRFFARSPRMRTRSPRTVQHRHPLFISTICSSLSCTRISLSTPVSPNSFSITAIFSPCCSWRIRLRSVVFPLPRKPVRMVTGMRSFSEGVAAMAISVG